MEKRVNKHVFAWVFCFLLVKSKFVCTFIFQLC